MKKILIIAGFLVFAICTGIIVGKLLSPKSETLTTAASSPVPLDTNPSFAWGVQTGMYFFNASNGLGYVPANVDKQISYLKQLGVNFARVNIEVTRTQDPYTQTIVQPENDNYINKLHDNGFNILMILDPDIPSTIGKVDYEQEGYNFAKQVATRYKGKIKYYQIANEVTGTIANVPGITGPTFNGENGLVYSQVRYDATLGWIKGMSKAIREQDPDAKIVLSGHWIMYDIFKKLIADGADFDIIGWAWYSTDGTDVAKREYNYGQYMDLGEKLSQFNKKIWIIEANSDHGSYMDGKVSRVEGQRQQSAWLNTFLTNLRKSKYFSGFFFFNLVDNPAIAQESARDSQWGMIELDTKGVIKPKPAFFAYLDFIKSHPN